MFLGTERQLNESSVDENESFNSFLVIDPMEVSLVSWARRDDGSHYLGELTYSLVVGRLLCVARLKSSSE